MKTAEEIFLEMKRDYEEKSNRLLIRGGDMELRMYAAACQAEALYINADFVLRQSFPQTATGQYLDAHARLRGITRKAAEKSRGTVTFSLTYPAESDIPIPEGTVCLTSKGTEFVTTEYGVIPEGEKNTEIEAEAKYGGEEGNVSAGEIIYMAQIPVGAEMCENKSPFTGGANMESDALLQSRVVNAYRSLPNGANSAWYEKNALDCPGAAAVSVIPKARGQGTVDVIVASVDGTADDELLSAVSERLKGAGEISADLEVKSASPILVNITVKVKVKSGYENEKTLAAVENSIIKLFGGKLLGKNLNRAQIGEAVYHTDGVENYVITAPDFDFIAFPEQLLTPGSITVENM